MHLILQRANGTHEHPFGGEYFGIWAKVVRNVDGGLGVQFLWGARRERVGFRRFIERISEKVAKEHMISAEGGAAVAHDYMQSEGELPVRGGDAAGVACEPGSGTVQSPPSTGDSPESNSPAPADGGESVPRTRDSRTGSTLVEFAFILLPLLAIIFGAIEMDRMLLVYNAIANSARAGVRYAVVHGYYNSTSDANIILLTRNFAGMGILDASKVIVTVTREDGTNHIGSPISVSVAYPFDPFTSFFPLSVTLRSTAKGTITF